MNLQKKFYYAVCILLLELISGREASIQNSLALIVLEKQYLHCNDKMTYIADLTLNNVVAGEFNSICEIDVGENVTRFVLHKHNFDICTYSRKEKLFSYCFSMSFLLTKNRLSTF